MSLQLVALQVTTATARTLPGQQEWVAQLCQQTERTAVFAPHPAAGLSCCCTFDGLVTGPRVEKFLENPWLCLCAGLRLWPELFALRTGGHWPQLPGNGAGLALRIKKDDEMAGEEKQQPQEYIQ